MIYSVYLLYIRLATNDKIICKKKIEWIGGPARLVELRASGRCVERVRSVVRERSRCVIGTSGQFDQRVRSARLRLFQVSNDYI
jgi:hypothetical protein